MKKNNIIFTSLLLTSFLTQCTENPLDNEQYFKQVYLVGAYDKVFTQKIMYNDTELQETFVSVAVSGSSGVDRNVDVTLEVVPEAITAYNNKYTGRYSSLPYYSVLPEETYKMNSLKATLKVGGEPFERIPVLLNTSLIHCDSVYALPFKIASVSNYQIALDTTLLLTLKMENEYSETYSMSASCHLLDIEGNSVDTIRSGRNKILKAVSQFETRMFFYDHNENDEKIVTDCLILTVNPKDNTVSVKAWDEDQFLYGSILNSGGIYIPEKKVFDLWYSYVNNDKYYKIREFLEVR